MTITPEGLIRWSNRGAERIFGYTAEEVIGRPVTLLMPERYRELCVAGLNRYLRTGEARVVGGTTELVGLRNDGSEFTIEMSLGETHENGQRLFTGVIRDITERKTFEEALERLSHRHEMVLESAGEGIFGLDLDGNATFVNPAAARMTGWEAEGLLGRPLHDILHHTKPDGAPYPGEHCPIYATHRDGSTQSRDDEVFWRKDGTSFPVEYVSTPIQQDGEVVTFKDITERKALEQQLRHQAFHDPLSGLPNRALFMDRLAHALALTDRRGGRVAVLFTDLDDFKVINDSLGHKAGDQLLVAFAERLKACLRPGDTAARLGGDEFTVLVEEIDGLGDAVRVAERIAESLQSPFALDQHEVFSNTSIGIALSSSAHKSPADLLRQADLAMYRATHKGKTRYEVFESSMGTDALKRLWLENELRQALERGEFRVYYQPILSLDNGRIVGAEALVRWDHPQRGLLKLLFAAGSERSAVRSPGRRSYEPRLAYSDFRDVRTSRKRRLQRSAKNEKLTADC